MSFNRLLALTYNGVTIGQGSSLGEPTGGWYLTLTPESGVVKMRFVVASTNSNALANMAAIEAAFSVRRQRLTIVYNGATTVNDFNPSFSTLTGYEAFPEIKHDESLPGPHSIGAETYEIAVRFRIPADNNGRRDEHPAIDRSLVQRRKVRFDGVWTAIGDNNGAREHFEDASTGFVPHATTFLNGYDNTVHWTHAVHDLVVNDTDTEVSYHVEFWEDVHGQVNEERVVHQDLHQLRRVLVRGTWVDPAGILSSSPLAALAAFNDATNGFVAQINTWLGATYSGASFALYSVDPKIDAINGRVEYSAELWECQTKSGVNTGRRFAKVSIDHLPSGRFVVLVTSVYMQTVVSGVTKTARDNYTDATNGVNALVAQVQTDLQALYGTPSTDWTAYTASHYSWNEELGIVESDLQFKELAVLAQSPTAVGKADTDIIDDNWDLVSTTEAPGDSPVVLSGQSIQGASGTAVRKPIVLQATYRAWIIFGVDPMTKWQALQAFVIQQVNTYLKPASTAGSLVSLVPEVDPRNNVLSVHITLEAYAAAYLDLHISETVSRDDGRIFSPRLSGKPDDYNEQQGPSVGNKIRTTRLLSTQAGAIFNFMSPRSIAGYERLRYRISYDTITRGVPPLQTTLYFYELVEEFLAVNGGQGHGTLSLQTQDRGASILGGGGGNVPQGGNGGGQVPAAQAQAQAALKNGGGGKKAGSSGGGSTPQQTFGIGALGGGTGGFSFPDFSDGWGIGADFSLTTGGP